MTRKVTAMLSYLIACFMFGANIGFAMTALLVKLPAAIANKNRHEALLSIISGCINTAGVCASYKWMIDSYSAYIEASLEAHAE